MSNWLVVVVRSCFCHNPMNNDAQVLGSEKHRKGPNLKGVLTGAQKCNIQTCAPPGITANLFLHLTATGIQV